MGKAAPSKDQHWGRRPAVNVAYSWQPLTGTHCHHRRQGPPVNGCQTYATLAAARASGSSKQVGSNRLDGDSRGWAEDSIRTLMPAMDTTRARVDTEVGLSFLSLAPHIDSSFVLYPTRKRRPSSNFDSISSLSQRERKSSQPTSSDN